MKTKKFIAEIKWGVTETDLPISSLPPEFQIAKQLCEKHDPAAFAIVRKFLGCSFNSSNIVGNLAEILNISEQVESGDVQIYGLDFKSSNLPAVRATATFDFQVVGDLTQQRLDLWEEQNEWLDNGISFYWNLPDQDDAFDPFFYSHQGSSFIME